MALISALLTLGSQAQRISDFDLYESSKGVVIKFYIEPGVACSGFSVLYCTDSLNFNVIYYDPGICGNQPLKEVKTYTHPDPSAGQKNFYRVRLEPFVEVSDPKSIYVKGAEPQSLVMYPNPQFSGSNELNFNIPDDKITRVSGILYDQYGKQMEGFELTHISDHWTFNTGHLNNGLYFISFTEALKGQKFKFVVLR
ncbi:MAG: T9SS type A sorting domain-containing protein [Bacteroidia bacterium]|nr:T9SS type A sorting domain-containing protein [Bacteroidia bacterium]